MAAKHICCTGGAGYIGSHTVVKLLESGYKVTIMDNLLNANKKVMARLKELTGQDVPLFEIDMCNAIVFSSSATVYRPCEEPLDEEKPTGCSNPYGWTKYMIEQILIDAAKANPKLAVSLLRYFNPVGAHPSGRIGEAPGGFPNNLMPFIQQVAVGRREALSVFGTDYNTKDGSGVRDYIHVEDLAEGHVCALTKILDMGSGCIIHNLGSGNGVSVLEMVKAFEESSGKTIPTKLSDRRPGDLATVVCNPGNANKDLQWTAKRSLKDMTDSVWKWVSANPYGYDDAPSS